MQILKTSSEAEFNAAVVPAGSILLFPSQSGSVVALKAKLSSGAIVDVVGGEGGGASDLSELTDITGILQSIIDAIPEDISELTDTEGLLSSGGGADWFLTWTAANFPQDWNEVIWTNIGANRPAVDYDSFKFPVFAVDYAVAEGMGAFIIDAIPAGAANLIVKIPTAPSDGAATGDNMGWKMDVVVNEGAISTVTLGSTALSSTTDEFVTGSYTVALSGISAAAGDMLTCLIYPDTAVATPKQCDWRVKYVRFEVS